MYSQSVWGWANVKEATGADEAINNILRSTVYELFGISLAIQTQRLFLPMPHKNTRSTIRNNAFITTFLSNTLLQPKERFLLRGLTLLGAMCLIRSPGWLVM